MGRQPFYLDVVCKAQAAAAGLPVGAASRAQPRPHHRGRRTSLSHQLKPEQVTLREHLMAHASNEAAASPEPASTVPLYTTSATEA